MDVRPTREEDLPRIVRISRAVYRLEATWREEELRSHLEIFPRGQLVAVDPSGRVVGMAASLVPPLDDFSPDADWWTLTGKGHFTTHDPERGTVLYGAGVLVDPEVQGEGVGTALYRARERLLEELGLSRIVAGARISGYARHAEQLTAHEYVERVVRKELSDPTLSFQLAQGFQVLRVVAQYLPEDRESLGYAAVVEWRP